MIRGCSDHAANERLLADAATHSPTGIRFELFLSGILVLAAAGLTAYLALG